MISEPIPQAISHLKLRYAFRQYNPPILDCIDTTAQVEETYRNAMGQIENTYHLFKTKLSEVGIDFDKVVNIHCYIVVSSRFPRESAIEQQLQVEFAQSLHLDLSFENVIDFM